MLEYFLFQGECLLRVILAGVCGGFIGFERKNRGKGAGVRTHLVVAAASALMMIISKYGFSDVSVMLYGAVSEIKLDPSRLAAQIVSGIGFLGAGMIYINRKSPQGLTTAAGIWATSGIGMAIGSGMYIMGLSVTAVLLVAQIILHKNIKFLKGPAEETLKVVVEENSTAVEEVKRSLLDKKIHIESIAIKRREDNLIELFMEVLAEDKIGADEILEIGLNNKFIRKIELNND